MTSMGYLLYLSCGLKSKLKLRIEAPTATKLFLTGITGAYASIVNPRPARPRRLPARRHDGTVPNST
jgi:hypothetical protein